MTISLETLGKQSPSLIALRVTAALPSGPIDVSITSDSNRDSSLAPDTIRMLTPAASLLRSLAGCVRQNLEALITSLGSFDLSGSVEASAAIDSRNLVGGAGAPGIDRIDLRIDLDSETMCIARPLAIVAIRNSLVYRTLVAAIRLRVLLCGEEISPGSTAGRASDHRDSESTSRTTARTVRPVATASLPTNRSFQREETVAR